MEPVRLVAGARHDGPPLWRAAVQVPAALFLAILSPSRVALSEVGAAAPFLRFGAQALAMTLALHGWYDADGADVGARVQDENLRILLILGGLVAAMFSGALGYLAFLEVLGTIL